MRVITERKPGVSQVAMKAVVGLVGPANELSIGTVETLSYGSSATALISGSAPLQTLSLALPEGRTGPVGEGSGGLFFESRAAAASGSIGEGIKTIRTAGFGSAADRGDALYGRRNTHPYQLWATGQTYTGEMNRPAFFRNSSGTLYILYKKGGGTTSVEPTHTTVGQSVTGADGYNWVCTALNPAYFHTADNRLADATTVDATNGGWWEIVQAAGELRIEQFGGSASYVNAANRGTDNFAPLNHAIKYRAYGYDGNLGAREGQRIRFGNGRYWVSDAIYVYEHITIEGNSTFQGTQTVLEFPNTSDGFVFHQGNTGPGGDGRGKNGAVGGIGESQGSTLRGITLSFGDTVWATDLTKHAIYARTTIHLHNVGIFRAPGRGVELRASAGYGGDEEGNANQFLVIGLYVHSCRSDAWWVRGADTNGGTVVGLNTHTEVGGCGLRNESYLPNFYSGMQITGYGNNGVQHEGKGYVLIRPDGGRLLSAGGKTPGTDNQYWYYMFDIASPTGQYPAWVDSGLNVPKMQIYDPGSGSRYYNPYVEGGGAGITNVLPGALIDGGNPQSSMYSNHQGKQGLTSTHTFGTNTPEEATQGSFTWVKLGGAGSELSSDGPWGSNGGLPLLSHRREIDGDATCEWAYRGGKLVYGYGSTSPFWEQTTRSTTATFGGNLPKQFLFCLYDHILQDNSDGNGGRKIGMRVSLGAVTQPGEHVRGDRYYNSNASPGGYEGWVCTQTGGVHNVLWSNGVAIDGNTILKTAAGRYYKNTGGFGGPSTIEPTHTSGTVATGDGPTWTWFADSAAVFKEFGLIAA